VSLAGRVAGVTAGAAAVAAVGGAARAAVSVNRRRRVIEARPSDATPFGSLRSSPRTIFTSDGVPLHVEVDEVDDQQGEPPPTLVFVHGYTLNLDCWHFQRAAFRGLVRSVYFDQRSHGRSGRSAVTHATIEQLGEDLLSVINAVVPDGPVVLVGHSMGGMSIVALAERHPELFGPYADGGRVVGVALISTTAGGIDLGRALMPFIPAKLSGGLTHGALYTLARGHRAVDGVRRVGRSVATVVTDALAFGDAVPPAYVQFVDEMISNTPFEVIAEFYPSIGSLDKFDHVAVLGTIPTTIIGGTADKLTSIGHSRKLHSRIPGSRLVECEGAGHMVLLERHGQVNAAIDQLLAAAARDAESA
jgi:pimeloyl-ACP methyl ester carboxylesterase